MSELNTAQVDAPQVQSQTQPQVQQVDIPNGNPLPMQGQSPGMQVVNPLKYPSGLPAQATSSPPVPPVSAPMPVPPSGAPEWVPSDFNDFDVNSLSDPILRSAASVMQSIPNIDLNRVMRGAVSHGDPSLIDFQYIQEACTGTNNNPVEIAKLAQGIVQAVQAQSESVAKDVYNAAGGEAAWNASVAVFNKTADPAVKVAVKNMLNSTDTAQIQAAARIVSDFRNGSGLLPNRGTVSEYVGAYPGVQGGAGLSGLDFKNAIASLRTHSLTPAERSAKTEELLERRKIGKTLGM